MENGQISITFAKNEADLVYKNKKEHMDRFYTSTLIARNIDVETSQSNYIQNKVKIRRTF